MTCALRALPKESVRNWRYSSRDGVQEIKVDGVQEGRRWRRMIVIVEPEPTTFVAHVFVGALVWFVSG